MFIVVKKWGGAGQGKPPLELGNQDEQTNRRVPRAPGGANEAERANVSQKHRNSKAILVAGFDAFKVSHPNYFFGWVGLGVWSCGRGGCHLHSIAMSLIISLTGSRLRAGSPCPVDSAPTPLPRPPSHRGRHPGHHNSPPLGATEIPSGLRCSLQTLVVQI